MCKRQHISICFMGACEISRGNSLKYLGVILSSNLSWTPQVERIVAKTQKLIRVLYRQFYQWTNPEVLTKIYIVDQTTPGIRCSCVEPRPD